MRPNLPFLDECLSRGLRAVFYVVEGPDVEEPFRMEVFPFPRSKNSHSITVSGKDLNHLLEECETVPTSLLDSVK